MRKLKVDRRENQVYSNRVVRSEFDNHWRMFQSASGYIVYVATANGASVEVLLSTGARKKIVFNRGGRVLVGGGGVSHYSKPHRAIDL